MSKRWPAVLLLTAVLALCGGCGVSAQPDIRPALGLPTGQLMRMPDLVGGSYDDALALLEGRAEIVKEEQFTGKNDTGLIIAQSIAAGAVASRNAPLTLTVSAGKPVTEIEDCTGMDFDEAADLLRRSGLTPNLLAVRDAAALWSVIGTEPAAGENAVSGSSVQVLVSAGPDAEMNEIPSFLGQPLAEVREAADALGLLLRAESERSLAPAGTVTSQSLAAGTECAAGTELRVTVSAGDTEPPEEETEP